MPDQTPAPIQVPALFKDLVDRILAAGTELGEAAQSGELQERAKTLMAEGEDRIADALSVPDTVEDRAKLRKQLQIGAGLGGLALLLSGRALRRTVQLAGLGAVGAVAYTAYKQAGGRLPGEEDDADQQVERLEGADAETRALSLLTAMVAAAQVDGQITNAERAMLLDAGEEALVEAIMADEPNFADVAALATSKQSGREIYAVSARIANGLNPLERDYLDRLAMALELAPEVAAMIETEMRM